MNTQQKRAQFVVTQSTSGIPSGFRLHVPACIIAQSARIATKMYADDVGAALQTLKSNAGDAIVLRCACTRDLDRLFRDGEGMDADRTVRAVTHPDEFTVATCGVSHYGGTCKLPNGHDEEHDPLTAQERADAERRIAERAQTQD